MNNTTKKIVWLASYPKSGNTWFRAFITALFNGNELDINDLKTDGIFSSRKLFDEATDLNSTLLYDDEAKTLQGEVFNYHADKSEQEHMFVKVHDAYTLNGDGLPIIPTQSTLCAIYIIRNPLDIAASLANHKDDTLDDTIANINDPLFRFSDQSGNLNTKTQFTQLLLDWSGHVTSWTGQLPFPVLVLRYEDMLTDTFNAFTKALNFIGIEATPQQVQTAVAASSFDKLKQKETETGFHEKIRDTSFFRSGKAGNWKSELNDAQINIIVNQHKIVMDKYGYLNDV